MTGLYIPLHKLQTALRVRFRLFHSSCRQLPHPLRAGAGETPDPHRSGKEVNRALCHLPSRKDQDGGRIGRVREPYDPRRAVPTPNADPRRAQMNRVFIGSDDPAADAAALIPALDAVDDAARSAAGLTASSPSRSC